MVHLYRGFSHDFFYMGGMCSTLWWVRKWPFWDPALRQNAYASLHGGWFIHTEAFSMTFCTWDASAIYFDKLKSCLFWNPSLLWKAHAFVHCWWLIHSVTSSMTFYTWEACVIHFDELESSLFWDPFLRQSVNVFLDDGWFINAKASSMTFNFILRRHMMSTLQIWAQGVHNSLYGGWFIHIAGNINHLKINAVVMKHLVC